MATPRKQKLSTIPTWTPQRVHFAAINLYRFNTSCIVDPLYPDTPKKYSYYSEIILFLDDEVDDRGVYENVLMLDCQIMNSDKYDVIELTVAGIELLYGPAIGNKVLVFDVDSEDLTKIEELDITAYLPDHD